MNGAHKNRPYAPSATSADFADADALSVPMLATSRVDWTHAQCPLPPPPQHAAARPSGLRGALRPGQPGVELCYQTFGDPDDEPLLLVMGLGGPMIWWDPELCSQLAAAAAST